MANLFEQLLGGDAAPSLLSGVVVGIVSNNRDPEKLGRVKVKFPWLSDEHESYWARVASPMAGPQRGFFCLPEVGDEVLVAFAHGSPDSPFILGALWNGKDKPPVTNDDGKNDVRLLKSRSGHQIVLNDAEDKASILIVDKSGENQILIDTANNKLSIKAKGDLTIEAGGNIRLAAQGKVEVEAGQALTAKAKTDLTLEAGSKGQLSAQAPLTLKSNAKASIEGGGQTEVKGAMVSINGSALTEVKGGLVKIN